MAPFEFIPWILGQCANLAQARTLLDRIHLVQIDFNPELPLSPLHWMIADREQALTVEYVREGLKVYDNPVGILTNNPPFEFQLFNLNNYMGLSKEQPENKFCKKIKLQPYSRGMGAMGLPGDLYESTRYTSCCNTDRGIYYYTTYENHQITGVDMHLENLDGRRLITYPLIQWQQIHLQNA